MAALSAGLEKSRGGFMSRLRGVLGGGPTDADWEEVEEILIGGDVGPALAMRVVERARRSRNPEGATAAVRNELSDLLVRREPAWHPKPAGPGLPAVILVVGVNGTGKTTTIGKLAARYRGAGETVLLAAGGHVPRGRHRPAPGLGRPCRRARRGPCRRRGPGRGRASMPSTRPSRAASTS